MSLNSANPRRQSEIPRSKVQIGNLSAAPWPPCAPFGGERYSTHGNPLHETDRYGVTVHGPGDGLTVRPVWLFPPPAADGRTLCLSAWAEGGSPLFAAKGVFPSPPALPAAKIGTVPCERLPWSNAATKINNRIMSQDGSVCNHPSVNSTGGPKAADGIAANPGQAAAKLPLDRPAHFSLL